LICAQGYYLTAVLVGLEFMTRVTSPRSYHYFQFWFNCRIISAFHPC